MKLLVGLGNPGQQYARTRHNAGFRFIEALAGTFGLTLAASPRFRAETAEGRIGTHRVLLARPQTFMNHSGESVGMLARYFQLPTERILVAYDDLDLPPGRFRLRKGGGHGGHNGLKSLNAHLPDAGYVRLRFGIGRPEHGEVTPWVLGRMTGDELALEARVFDAVIAEIETILNGDLARAANNIHLRLSAATE